MEGKEEDAVPGRACGILSYILLSSSLLCGESCRWMDRRQSRSAL